MSRGVWAKGTVYLQELVNNVPKKEMIPVEAVTLGFKVNAELVERFGKSRDNWGDAIGSVAKKGSSEVTLGFQEVDAKLMALVQLGTSEPLSIAGGSEAGETVVISHQYYSKLLKSNISNSAIAGSVIGVDFEENKNIGAIKGIATGNIADGASVSVAYDFGAITAKRIAAGSKSQNDYRLTFDGQWLEDGVDFKVVMPKITLTPNSDFELLSDEYVSPEFTAKAIKLPDEVGAIIFDDDIVYA